MTNPIVYVCLRDVEMRWQLRRAAVERRVTIAVLVYRILRDWLVANGYQIPQKES
jgi:hypothetical protein